MTTQNMATPAAKSAPVVKEPVGNKPAPAKAKPTQPAQAAVKKPVTNAKAKKTIVQKPAKPVAAKATAAKPVITKPAAAKVKKPKLVRDSFTMPKEEYAVIDTLKLRAGKLGQAVKKSELLRAGIKVLATLSDIQLKAALTSVPTLKTGRPKHVK